jgi:hypothetical protein
LLAYWLIGFKQERDMAKAKVSRRALIQRINRALRHESLMLRVTRGQMARLELGDYYTVNFLFNSINGSHHDLEELGREVGALRKYEMLEGETA